jgi:hypothetical protein
MDWQRPGRQKARPRCRQSEKESSILRICLESIGPLGGVLAIKLTRSGPCATGRARVCPCLRTRHVHSMNFHRAYRETVGVDVASVC